MTKTCPCILDYEKDIRVGFSLFLMGFDAMPKYLFGSFFFLIYFFKWLDLPNVLMNTIFSKNTPT